MKDLKQMKRLMESVVERIANNPVPVSETETLKTITFDLKPEAADVGRLVGNRGDMVLALEIVFGAMARQLGKHIVVNVHKTLERVRDYYTAPPNPDYNSLPELELLEDMVEFMFHDAAVARETTHMSGEVEFTVACDQVYDEPIATALTTIFAAIGAKAGVKICVKVEEL